MQHATTRRLAAKAGRTRLLVMATSAILAATALGDVTNTFYVSSSGSKTYPFETPETSTDNPQLAVLVAEQAYGPGTQCVVRVVTGTYTMPTYGNHGYRRQTERQIATISGDGTNVTVVTADVHGIAADNVDDFANNRVGQWVRIAGNTSVPVGYRGFYRVSSVVNATTFTYLNATTSTATPGTDAKAFALPDFAMVRITRPIILIGEGGRTGTVFNAAGTSATDRFRRVLEVHVPGGGAVIRGFTIRGGYVFNHSEPNVMLSPVGQFGSGAYVVGGTLEDCRLTSNQIATGGNPRLHGAGAYIGNGGTVRNCLVDGNTISLWGSGGAGVSIVAGGLLSHSVISNNTAAAGYTSSDEAGGGVLARGGTIRNCLIRANTGVAAGGIYINGSPTVENCTFVGNTGYTHTTAPQNGQDLHRHYNSAGGLFVRLGTPILRNNLFFENQGQPNHGDAYQVYNVNTNRQLNPPVQPLDIVNLHTYSLAPELAIATSVGNLTDAPVFVNAASADYRLAAGSPGINVGHPGPYSGTLAWIAEAGTADLAGAPRLQQNRLDMGTFEWAPPRGTLIAIK